MDNVARYAAINTKVRALQGKLLKDEDYINLLSKKTMEEVAAYLKQNIHYKEALEEVDINDAHRSSLEVCLKRSQVSVLKELAHYFYDDYREFYRTLFIRHEIKDIKSMLRGIKTGGDNENDKESFKRIGLYSKVNIDSLLQSKNIKDFIKNLKGTVYYSYLRPIAEGREDISLFGVEMILDLAYFDLFYRALRLISKEDQEIMRYIQGVNVDMLNIQWIYRGLKFYNLPPEELFNYTVAYGRDFSRDEIKKLCYIKSVDEFEKRILNTRYKFLVDVQGTRDMFMERRMLRYQYFSLKSVKRKSGFDISQVIVYLLFFEMEVRDIISIIENIRYGMPVEEAKKFLIRKL